MHMIVAVLVFVLQTLYQAKVSTFGCTSTGEVAELQSIRSDTEAFQKRLYAQVAYGQCIAISKGAVVEGTIETADSSVLLINARLDPPGYLVPRGDFKPVKAEGKR